MTFWTEADAAERDVLVHALTTDFDEHRKHCLACNPDPCPEYLAWLDHKQECEACQGLAPLTFGAPCQDWHERRLEHGRTCPRCNPCPHLIEATHEVVYWTESRELLSRADEERRKVVDINEGVMIRLRRELKDSAA